MIIFYYCTTNYHKFSSLKYHSFITQSTVDKKYSQACLTLLLRQTQGQSLSISQAWILSVAPRKQVTFQTHFKCTVNFIYFLIGGKLLYNFVFVSAIQQCKSVLFIYVCTHTHHTHTHTYTHIYIYIPPPPRGLYMSS